jgi:hypothetical protein
MENDRYLRSRFAQETKWEAQDRLERNEAVAALVQHRQGRRYLYWLIGLGKVGANPFTANALATAHQCGELNVGLQIQAHLLEVAPQSFLTMLQEHEDERRSRERSLASNGPAADDDGAADNSENG